MSNLSSITGAAGRIDPTVRGGAEITELQAAGRRRTAKETSQTSPVRVVDTVDLSELAKRAARAEAPFRADLVQKIKTQIEAGTYESADKIEAAVEQIVKDMNLSA